jgi:hypothetical protein
MHRSRARATRARAADMRAMDRWVWSLAFASGLSSMGCPPSTPGHLPAGAPETPTTAGGRCEAERPCTRDGWCREFPVPFATGLRGMWRVSTGEVIAVGDGGTILELDGTRLRYAHSGAEGDLHAVHGEGDQIYAVGDHATLLKRQGTCWAREEVPVDADAPLLALAVGRDDLVVTSIGAAWQRRRGQWQKLELPRQAKGQRLAAVTSNEAGDLWIGGDEVVFARVGGKWLPPEKIGRSTVSQLHARGDVVWALSHGRIFRRERGAWTETDHPADGGDVAGWTGVVALDERRALASHASGAFGLLEGTTFRPLASLAEPSVLLWANGVKDVIAFGRRIQRFNGRSWRPVVDLPTSETLRGIWGLDEEHLYAMGDNGTVLRRAGSEWVTLRESGELTDYLEDAWGPNAQQLFVVGENKNFLEWRERPGEPWASVSVGDTPLSLTAIWGTTFPDGGSFAVAAGRNTITRWDGSAWRIEEGVVDPAADGYFGHLDVWGSSPTDVYVVGGHGPYHFDGEKWSPVTALLDLMAEQSLDPELVGVWGSGPSDVFFLHTWGIFHFDGSSFTHTPATEVVGYQDKNNPRDYFTAIGGLGPNRVWAVGTRGRVARFDGKQWRHELSGTSTDQTGVWGTGDRIYVAGRGGVIVKEAP